MENSFYLLADIFGIKTVLSSIAVCAVLWIIKKKKPNLSQKAEIGIRFLISVLIGLCYLLITKTDLSELFVISTQTCGVSMLVCGLLKGNGETDENRLLLSKFLPDLTKKQLDEIIALEEKETVKNAIKNNAKGISNEHIEILSLVLSSSIENKNRAIE